MNPQLNEADFPSVKRTGLWLSSKFVQEQHGSSNILVTSVRKGLLFPEFEKLSSKNEWNPFYEQKLKFSSLLPRLIVSSKPLISSIGEGFT